MADVIRLRCPECGLSKEKRIKELKDSIAGWVYDKDLRDLLGCFGVVISTEGSFTEYIEELWQRIQIWDFRKGDERWNIKTDDPRIDENRLMIEQVSRRLGLLDITDTVIDDPDYILALGGARMTNYNTPLKARQLVDEHGWKGVSVAGLSAYRPAADRDMPHFEKYAEGALTEFDAMCGGLEKVFGLGGYKRTAVCNDNPFLCSETRVYDRSYKGGSIYALAAPSSEPEKRRADTLDTLLYFLEGSGVGENSRMILTTNSIYVPFQLMRLMDIALERNIMIDCVGVRAKERIPEGKHSMYLQEIKATVDAIHGLGWEKL